MKPLAIALLALIMTACGGSVQHAKVACSGDFRNDTQGVLSDGDLAVAWQHAQQTIANGQWVINAIDCDKVGGPPCEYHAPDARALSIKPECLGVKGVMGLPYPGADGVTDDSHNIAINISKGHDRAWNLVAYEDENVLGIRLGFPMSNR